MAFLLACGACFSIGAYFGASPTDPLGVRDILGVGNANVARPIAPSTRAQTECPRPVKCEPPPRCEPEEIVREVQVERECPACEACPKVPEEAPEEAEEASDAASEESKPAAGVATNPLLAAARPEKEPTARVESKLDTSGDAGDANGDAIAEDGVPVPVPVPVQARERADHHALARRENGAEPGGVRGVARATGHRGRLRGVDGVGVRGKGEAGRGGRARGARRGRGAPRSASPRVASQGYTRRGGRAGGRRRRHRETLRHRAQGTVKSATRSELGFRFWFAGEIFGHGARHSEPRAPLHRCGDAVARPG